MKRHFTTMIIVLIFLTIIQISTSISLAQVNVQGNAIEINPTMIMSTDEIIPGMKGIAKTVISGVDIEEFDVEILGILRDANQELILVKVSGPVIDLTGGIAAGMSGSPVYIEDKLIGAIGYGWSLTDHRIGLVTPIKSMLKILQLQIEKPKRSLKVDFDRFQADSTTAYHNVERRVLLAKPMDLGGRSINQIYFCDSYEDAVQYESNSEILVAYPVKTPLMVNGLRGRALERLVTDFENFNLIPIQTGSSKAKSGAVSELKPGSALAVQLVRGDINISSIGTVTYIEEGDILAFGHPFLNIGQVELILSGAEILTVIDNLDMPFKLGTPTGVYGVITQDRNAGIGGKLGQNPKVIPVNVLVADYDLQVEAEYQFQVIPHEELVVPLVVTSILQTLDTTMDRQGYGTAKVSLGVFGDKLPEQIYKYENLYYSGFDIAIDSIYDLYSILHHIVTNPFLKVNLGSIEVQIQVEQIRQFAIIEEVKLLNENLYPGDIAEIQVSYRPYRAEPYNLTYKVKIPDNIQTGPASLTISSGIYGSYGYSLEEGNEGSGHTTGDYYKSLKEILDHYQNKPKNNDLVIEIMPYYMEASGDIESTEDSGLAQQDRANTGDNQSKKKDAKEVTGNAKGSLSNEPSISRSVREFFKTEYVLEGSVSFEITILELEEPVSEVMNEEKPKNTSKNKETGKHI